VLHQIKLTYGRRFLRLHQHPASGGWGSGGRDHSFGRCLGQQSFRFGHLDPAGL